VDLLSLHYEAPSQTLNLLVSNDDLGTTVNPEDSIVLCPEYLKFTLPAGPPLGAEGDPIWILPQSPYEGAPYLGISTETIPSGTFVEPLDIQLQSIEGPGDFILWQSTSFGTFDIRIDTRDGLDDTDRITPPAGAHEHYNWGFTSSGLYRLHFQGIARPTSQDTNLVSDIATYTFHILPLTPFESWTVTHWPCETNPNTIAPESDPDLDGAPNALEYAVGTDPNSPDPGPWLKLEPQPSNNPSSCLLTYQQSKSATDIILTVYTTDNPASEPWQPLVSEQEQADLGNVYQIKLLHPLNPSGPSHSYYQLQATFDP
jgi:surface-anchored protein